jgi:hypothetical protein
MLNPTSLLEEEKSAVRAKEKEKLAAELTASAPSSDCTRPLPAPVPRTFHSIQRRAVTGGQAPPSIESRVTVFE